MLKDFFTAQSMHLVRFMVPAGPAKGVYSLIFTFLSVSCVSCVSCNGCCGFLSHYSVDMRDQEGACLQWLRADLQQ